MNNFIEIPAVDFCTSHQVEVALIERFHSYGLIEIIRREQVVFIPETQIQKLEKVLVFHRDLEINLEGIETIFELLQKLETMQEQIITLETQLKRFK